MKTFLKYMLTLMLIPCLLLAGCSKNTILTIYKVKDGALTSRQVKLKDKESTLSDAVWSFIKAEGVVSRDSEIVSFKSEGSDTYRTLALDLNSNFRAWLSAQENELQRLTVQAIANTYLHNFSGDSITFTIEGEGLKTGIYDFTEPLFFKKAGTSQEETSATPFIEATPEITLTPEITEAPIITLTPTLEPTNTVEPVTTPLVTPPREEGKKYVAMTFDDGPHSKYTTMLVDKLKEYNAGATFFVIGNRVNDKTGPQIKYAADNGCEIAIHAYTHEVYYNSCSDERFKEELSKTHDVIKKYTGISPTLMRPVGGKITDARVKSCGYSVIMWNVDSEDWKHKKAQQSEIDAIVNNVMSTVGNGKIILMHEIYENSYQAFCIIMEKLYAQGYEVVTVTDLIGKENLKPGTKFFGG